jgi:hypothetical protein
MIATLFYSINISHIFPTNILYMKGLMTFQQGQVWQVNWNGKNILLHVQPSKMDPNSCCYILWTKHRIRMIYIPFEKGGSNVSITTITWLTKPIALQQHQLRPRWLLRSSESFPLVNSLDLSQRLRFSIMFRLCLNTEPQTRKSICRWNRHFQQEAVSVKAKAPADRMYQRRMWDASHPLDRPENLEYRNQLSSLCCGEINAPAIPPTTGAGSSHKRQTEACQILWSYSPK